MIERGFKEKIKKTIDGSKGCPICSIVLEYEFDLLAKIQYGISQDESLRREIAIEGGFCDFHYRQFKRLANFKTNTLLLQSIVESGFFKNTAAEINCRICRVINKAEDGLINDMTELLAGKDFQNNFEQSYGVCAVHLKGILKVIKPEGLKEWLVRIHQQQIERYKTILEELNSANSYWDIEMGKREFVNLLIQKFAGRKTAGV